MSTSMSTFSALELAFKSGSKDEVSKALQLFVDTPLSSEERGAVFVGIAMLYMKLKTELNQDYAEVLKKTIQRVQSITTQERKLGDAVKIQELKQSI
jgi:hypothetical protein